MFRAAYDLCMEADHGYGHERWDGAGVWARERGRHLARQAVIQPGWGSANDHTGEKKVAQQGATPVNKSDGRISKGTIH